MKNKRVTKSTVKWIATLGAILIGFIYIFWLDWSLRYDQVIIETLYKHLAAIIGIPSAIITAFVLVTTLEQVSGAIEFEVLGFKFKGASGPVVLWIACFLAIVLGIKILW